ncbi:hypothetical protein AB0I53_05015 [Saccharopolyspora sp. NPDC050389]|uniref:hypothetical protein n=1 Tax=Saccharopolyspora sp. NPDC050389 TaxID=3155516 RepID=UPI0033E1B5C2
MISRDELVAAAVEVLRTIYASDLHALVHKFGSLSALLDTVVERAWKVAAKLEKTAAPVGPDECGVLAAACLTWGRWHSGVHGNTSNAAAKFRRYRRFPVLPYDILVRVGRVDSDDDDRTIALLARTVRIRRLMTDARPVGEPELLLNVVVPAIVEALVEIPGRQEVSDADATDIVLDVLEHGARLTAEYRVAGLPAPSAGNPLPVAGNADFLVRLAAYRIAIAARRGLVGDDPLGELAKRVPELAGILNKAMTRPAGSAMRRGPDESDVAVAIDQFAVHLGSSGPGGRAAGKRVNAVHRVLNHRLHLDENSDQVPVDDLDQRPSPGAPDHGERLSDVEQLAAWFIANLFAGAESAARDPLLAWLRSKQDERPKTRDLLVLVRRLRIATDRLSRLAQEKPDELATAGPPWPQGITQGQFKDLIAQLAAATDPSAVDGCTLTGVHQFALAALNPLWSERAPVVKALTGQLMAKLTPDARNDDTAKARAKAAIIVRHGARAPMQFVERSTRPRHEPCCPGTGRTGSPREPVAADEICPHRQWGETGLVENYSSLGESAGIAPDAARRQLERYQGPWPELLRP